MAARFAPPRDAGGRLRVRTRMVDARPKDTLPALRALIALGQRLQQEQPRDA